MPAWPWSGSACVVGWPPPAALQQRQRPPLQHAPWPACPCPSCPCPQAWSHPALQGTWRTLVRRCLDATSMQACILSPMLPGSGAQRAQEQLTACNTKCPTTVQRTLADHLTALLSAAPALLHSGQPLTCASGASTSTSDISSVSAAGPPDSAMGLPLGELHAILELWGPTGLAWAQCPGLGEPPKGLPGARGGASTAADMDQAVRGWQG
jgi:hypothetical protein